MKPVDKQKMCPSCEGRIPLEAEICPFCASDQSNEKVKNSFQAPLFEHQSLQESLTSLYKPLYPTKRATYEEQQELFPPSYKEPSQARLETPMAAAPIADTLPNMEEAKEVKSSLWPTVFMITGSNFFILGLIQLLFSDQGLLKLEWESGYWYFYCLAALPFLYLGIKKLKELE